VGLVPARLKLQGDVIEVLPPPVSMERRCL
jgi:hypothetical protein